jgi:hypothetical protein
MSTGPVPRWMQPLPEQPAAGNGAATPPPASPAPKPGGPAASRVTNAPPSPLHVRSTLDGIVEPDALEAAGAAEDQKAQELGDAMDAPPKKPGDYKLPDPPRDSAVQPMSGQERTAVAQLLHSLEAPAGIAQAVVLADYTAQAAGAPRGEAALTASSSKAMHQLALGIQGKTGVEYDVARAEAAKLASEVDDYMVNVVGKRDPRVAIWWTETNVSNDSALLKMLHAYIGRTKARAAKSS